MNREERGGREDQGLIGGAAGETLADIRLMAPAIYNGVCGAFIRFSLQIASL